MEGVEFNELFNRNHIAKSIENDLENFYKNNKNDKIKRGIYLHGKDGIGKTRFVLDILKKLDYDIIYYDNSVIRNKQLIENIGENSIGNNNVYSMLLNKKKKKVIVLDDIYSMAHGDKTSLVSLIKLIRQKKKKRK